jgi:hypothetical protein
MVPPPVMRTLRWSLTLMSAAGHFISMPATRVKMEG